MPPTAQRWLLTSLNVAHDNTIGSKTVQGVFRLESSGPAGQTIVYPAPGQVVPSLPVIPVTAPYPSMPPLPDITLPPSPIIEDSPPYSDPLPKGDGSVVVIWSATQVWTAPNFISTSHPAWNEVTPPYAYTIAAVSWIGDALLVLMNDLPNDQSFVAYAVHGTSTTPEWTLGAAVVGTYQTIRTTVTGGEVYIAGISTVTTSGGCNLSGWIVALGTEVSRDDSSIVVHNVLVDGSYVAEIKSAGTNDCCTVTVVGTTINAANVECNPCGDAYPGDFPTALPSGLGCVNAVLAFRPFAVDMGDVTFTFDHTISSCGTTTTSTARVAYSTDFGATFATPKVISPSLLVYMGFDTEKVGTPTLAGQGGQVEIATSAGGAYSDYGSAFPTNAGANCIHIPRYQFGSASSGNISTNTPQYLAASATLTAGNESLWKVTASGATFTSITINIGGQYGLAVSPNCMTMAYKSGKRLAGILLFGSDYHLVTSGTSGAAFTDRGVMASDAAYVRFRKTDLTMQQLFIADGNVKYSGNFGATVLLKVSPTADPIIGIEPFSF